MPRSIGAVVSSGKATLYECQTVYGIKDMYDLLDIVLVDAHNNYQINKASPR